MMDVAFFAEMAWKSALIAGAALILAHTLRSRSAADRALVLRLGVTMLLLLPLIAVLLPELRIVAFAAPEPLDPIMLSEAQFAALAAAGPAPEPTIWDDPTPLVILAYLGGLAMVGSRLLAGLWLLRRWTRNAKNVTCPEWLAAFDRVRWIIPNAESVRLMVSDEVYSPLSWGWRRPVILIDPDTLDQSEDAEAILAHEAAHVARRDWPALILSRLAATLFWFNPLVWALEREVVQQAEEAADCEAADRVEPARYAETLLHWAQGNHMVPANSIAPSARALGRRVRAILDRRSRERPSGSAWTAVAMILCLGITAPVAAMQLVEAEPPAPPPAPAPAAPEAPAAPRAPAAPTAPTAHELGDSVVITVPSVTVGSDADEVVRVVLPRIPMIVANATAAVDPEAIEQALREADRELQKSHRRLTRQQRRQIEHALRESNRGRERAIVVSRAQIDEAVRNSQRARAHVVIPHAEIAAAMRQVQVEVPRAIAFSMAHGADGMLRGAEGMERGARGMEEEARRLENRDYREQAIARARERGETVTHEELIEAAEGLREGAEGMRDGARDMREAAERMRERHNED